MEDNENVENVSGDPVEASEVSGQDPADSENTSDGTITVVQVDADTVNAINYGLTFQSFGIAVIIGLLVLGLFAKGVNH